MIPDLNSRLGLPSLNTQREGFIGIIILNSPFYLLLYNTVVFSFDDFRSDFTPLKMIY